MLDGLQSDRYAASLASSMNVCFKTDFNLTPC